RTILNFVHPQNGGLWRVQNRSRQQRTENTTLGEGKGTAPDIIDTQLAITATLGAITNGAFNFGQAHAVGVTQYRYDQTALGGYRHADVLITVIHHVVTID